MIRFTLSCTRTHEFEGWFKNGATFERQTEEGAVACPVCGSTEVKKAIMAPAVTRGGEARDAARAAALLQTLRQVREHVEKNFENVGGRFAEEARRIHYGEAEPRDIVGQATPAEARELREEGIKVQPLPELPKLDG